MFPLIVAAILGAIIWYLHHKLTFWQRQGIPTPGLLYQLHYYRKELGPYDQELHKKLGSVYGTYEGLTPILILGEPDLIREVLVKESQSFPNHKPDRLGIPIFDNNLFSLDAGEDWKRIRSLVTPTFTPAKLRGMDRTVHDSIDVLKKHLAKAAKEGNLVDVRRFYNSLSFDIILRCTYSTKVDVISEPDDPIMTNMENIFSGKWDALLTVLFPKFAKISGLADSAMKPFKFFENMTRRLMEDRQSGKGARSDDFVQLMIDANKEAESNKESGSAVGISKKTISTDEMIAQGLNFLVDGFDTPATFMACCAYHLSKHPEVQSKLTAEISKLLVVNHDTVMELKYMDAVLKECLRLSPPTVRVERQCVKSIQLGKAKVQPGTIVSIPVFAVHRDPRSYSNPEVFDPSRFLEGGKDVNHHPYALIPFGGGPRMCIGQRFALMEAKMALALIMQTFHFEATSETKLNYAPASFDLLAPKEILLKIKAL